MKRRFIANPAAGRGIHKEAFNEARRFFEAQEAGFDRVWAESRENAIELTRAALREGCDLIVALGGDGTLNAVANGFFENGQPIRPGAILGASNLGTGSDYFRAVSNGKAWMEIIASGKPRAIDVGEIRGLASDEAFYFLNIGGVGLSTQVVRQQRKMPRWLPPIASYTVPALQSVLTAQPFSLSLEADGQSIEGKFLNVFFAKGHTAGGGMKIGGNVTFDDGLFDITLVHGMGTAESLVKFGKLFTGDFSGDNRFTKLKAKSLTIRCPEPRDVEGDGEILTTTDVTVSVKPRALNFLFP